MHFWVLILLLILLYSYLLLYDCYKDIVRVLVLDESQSQHFQGAMPSLLKKIGLELAEANYQVLYTVLAVVIVVSLCMISTTTTY